MSLPSCTNCATYQSCPGEGENPVERREAKGREKAEVDLVAQATHLPGEDDDEEEEPQMNIFLVPKTMYLRTNDTSPCFQCVQLFNNDDICQEGGYLRER